MNSKLKALTELNEPAFIGLKLSYSERVAFAEQLTQLAEKMNPYPRPAAFGKSFDSFEEYAEWKKEQTNPWLF